MSMRSVGWIGPESAVTPGLDSIMVSTSSGAILPALAALAAASASA